MIVKIISGKNTEIQISKEVHADGNNYYPLVIWKNCGIDGTQRVAQLDERFKHNQRSLSDTTEKARKYINARK